MEGTSAVGCAKKMVLPTKAFSCTAASPIRPRRTCFQQQRPKDASIFVALEARRTCRRSRPTQLSLTQAFTGNFGFFAARSAMQPQQANTKHAASPMPAQGGRGSAG